MGGSFSNSILFHAPLVGASFSNFWENHPDGGLVVLVDEPVVLVVLVDVVDVLVDEDVLVVLVDVDVEVLVDVLVLVDVVDVEVDVVLV